MSPDSRDEAYWLGVRDALRMIDSFLTWSRRNPEKAKSIDDFLNEALIAAAKRCESCLSHALGIAFSRTGQAETDSPQRSESRSVDFLEDTRSMIKDSPLARTLTDPGDLYSEQAGRIEEDTSAPTDAELPEFTEGDFEERIPAPPEPYSEETLAPPAQLDESGPDELPSEDEQEGEGASIDYLEPSQEPSRDEMEFTDRRSFESDFELVEPRPFDTDAAGGEPEISEKPIDEHDAQTEVRGDSTESEREGEFEFPEEKLPEALDQLERDFSSHGLTISPTEGDLDDEVTTPIAPERVPGMDESTREAPSVPEPNELEIPVASEDNEPHEVEIEQEPTSEYKSPLPEKKTVWSPYDEPSTLEEEPDQYESSDEGDSVKDPLGDVVEKEPPAEPEVKAPPPPPPPPESGETEEERRRRARRLFFGT